MRLEHLLDGVANDLRGKRVALDAAGAGDVDAHGLAVEIDDRPAALRGLEHGIVLYDRRKTIPPLGKASAKVILKFGPIVFHVKYLGQAGEHCRLGKLLIAALDD